MQMKRLVMMVVAAGVAVVAEAMPTKANLQKAKELIDDVTAADVKALKAGTKKPAEVAATHMDLAAKAGTEAEKYLLLQGAFKLYAKAGDYDAAANVIEKLQAEISDYDPEVTVELCGAEFIRKMRENAPRLYALKENARRIVFYRRQLPIRAAAVRKNPKDVQAQRKLAECHAELGDWPKALDVFVEAGGEFKKIAEGEKNGKIAAQELGDYWWDYETKSETPIYKLHAAEFYRKALADNSFKGLARTRAEQRIEEADKAVVDLPPVQPSSGSAPSTVDASLVHRWSFTKDFIDSVGKIEAKKRGNSVMLENGQCVVKGGGLDVGDVLKQVGVPFTVEFWYSEIEQGHGKFLFGRLDGPGIRGEAGSKYAIQWKAMSQRYDLIQLPTKHRAYFAIACDGQKGTAYACDMDGDKRLNEVGVTSDDIRYGRERLLFGGTVNDKCFPSGKYDEIRIWRVCKSKEDISATIMAGPDRVVMPKAQTTIDSTSVSAPSSTARPAPMTLDLGKEAKLAMHGCPAGKFTMDWSRTGEDLCEVTISKPFWMAETMASERFWASVMGGSGEKSEPQSAALADAKQFLANCNQKFADKIPEGYEFRFPTYAEYDYVLKVGGAADPNKWNLRGMRMKNGRVWLADRLHKHVDEKSVTAYKGWWDCVRITRIKWPKTATDPLIPISGGSGKIYQVFLSDNIEKDDFAYPLADARFNAKACVRLVLAPKPGTGLTQASTPAGKASER